MYPPPADYHPLAVGFGDLITGTELHRVELCVDAVPYPEGVDPAPESPPGRHAPVSSPLQLRDSPHCCSPAAAVLKSGTRDADGTNSRRGRLDRPGLLADLHGVGAAASRPEPWMTEVATDDKQPSPDGLDAGAATLIGA